MIELTVLTIARESNNASSAGKPSNKASDHKNESFLKSAWHRLTHQHDNLEPDKPEEKPEEKPKKEDEAAKKASGSGS